MTLITTLNSICEDFFVGANGSVRPDRGRGQSPVQMQMQFEINVRTVDLFHRSRCSGEVWNALSVRQKVRLFWWNQVGGGGARGG